MISRDSVFYGDSNRFEKHISADSANTTFIPVNLYNVTMPLLNVGINPDDGFLIGVGISYIPNRKDFGKSPFASQYQLMLTHSFSTSAFSVSYNGQWTNVLGKADLTLQANIFAPANTQNFYGSGNETTIDKSGDYKKYYRARFNLYYLNAGAALDI